MGLKGDRSFEAIRWMKRRQSFATFSHYVMLALGSGMNFGCSMVLHSILMINAV